MDRWAGWHRFLLGLPLLIIGLVAFVIALADPSVAGAYIAFLSALSLWGWIEITFLSGLITGPNKDPCPTGLSGIDRFSKAWATIAHHELLLAGTLVVLIFVSEGAENRIGLWTFGVLFLARISAKLNLFFGVPRFHTEFLPRALSHLPSYFRQARINPFFPISVTLLAFAVACWLERVYAADSTGASVGFALLAAITALALLEHWLMVLPLPDEKLWRWMIPVPKPENKRLISEDPHGL